MQGIDKIMETLDNIWINVFVSSALQFPLFVHPLYVCKVYTLVIKSITKNVVITFTHNL